MRSQADLSGAKSGNIFSRRLRRIAARFIMIVNGLWVGEETKEEIGIIANCKVNYQFRCEHASIFY